MKCERDQDCQLRVQNRMLRTEVISGYPNRATTTAPEHPMSRRAFKSLLPVTWICLLLPLALSAQERGIEAED
ncbi:MAG: hypothetical protein EA351_06320 [Gemmatimonadales bacterium]|nr:MAG: hypothetical protein EA351_06320 [Gemmatimonadales bacterium]